ncbi:unnamed protein product [Pedinophyceae sp. YPF-701]|nr:unnamed protein product [Pedinophyceae sp. YPF-701]
MGAETETKPKVIFRKDYTPTPYNIKNVNLTFKLDEDFTTVQTRLAMKPTSAPTGADLVLNGGEDVKLVSISVDGTKLDSSSYTIADKRLTVKGSALPASGEYVLETEVHIKPQDNTSLEGLYKSSGNFCTQCEAEGFRNITYFLDRPDVMTEFTVRIEADKSKYPVMLSNGNLVEEGALGGGKHFAVWHDPHPKPCYLFALVAGDLAVTEDSFKTASGRDVKLRIYAQAHNMNKTPFAMESLKKAMLWDEKRFGLEYDLDLFNIVAVDDFNMGAMENKSLNIFNSRLVLASPETATDVDFYRIEGVVGHEYFHNWTGNRVTCRDWFQLTLKEGLTVFRDQEFSADMNSRPVQRIDDVVALRSRQFAEDSGPMAHPIRPDSYIKMDNFYTLTVYEKGAEVVRMYQTLLGVDGFRKGMDLYFSRHDGQAVTCDDFLAAMADANGRDLSHMQNWYSQAGTPDLHIDTAYDAAAQTFTLTCKQSTPDTPGQTAKKPVLVPIAMGLLGPDGSEMPLTLSTGESLGTSTVLEFADAEKSYTFTGVAQRPVPSLLRGFSAPVKLEVAGQTDEDLLLMMAHDTDSFNRWEAGQRLLKKLAMSLYGAAAEAGAAGDKAKVRATLAAAGGVPESIVGAVKAVLTDKALDGSFKAMAISIPSPSELVDAIPEADPTLIHDVRSFMVGELAARLRPEFEAEMAANASEPGAPYVFSAPEMARRNIRSKCLAYLSSLGAAGDTAMIEDIYKRFKEATNMTDQMAAAAALNEIDCPQRQQVLDEFYQQYKDEPLVLLKWLTLCSTSNVAGNTAAVEQLMADESRFNIKNPNSCYSLFGGFAASAHNFHNADGSGYKLLADAVIQLDDINGQVAARIVAAFTRWKKYDQGRQALMKAQLQRIAAKKGLTDNVYEIVSKSLE